MDNLTEKLIDKFPELDSSWPPGAIEAWFSHFGRLLAIVHPAVPPAAVQPEASAAEPLPAFLLKQDENPAPARRRRSVAKYSDDEVAGWAAKLAAGRSASAVAAEVGAAVDTVINRVRLYNTEHGVSAPAAPFPGNGHDN